MERACQSSSRQACRSEAGAYVPPKVKVPQAVGTCSRVPTRSLAYLRSAQSAYGAQGAFVNFGAIHCSECSGGLDASGST